MRNGAGATSTLNGTGNLIIGYDEQDEGDRFRVRGSHNLVIGPQHEYSSWGGLIAGMNNAIAAPGASVLGGEENTASERNATVAGGHRNLADGFYASVTGGEDNAATRWAASVTGRKYGLPALYWDYMLKGYEAFPKHDTTYVDPAA